MSAMTLPELREVATRNKSVNAHLASAWSLRWHDPFWLSSWERWQKALEAWRKIRMKYTTRWEWKNGKATFLPDEMGPGGIYNPDPSGILDSAVATVAREYIEAREAYKAANKLYPGDS